jgi:hypothetical protein
VAVNEAEIYGMTPLARSATSAAVMRCSLVFCQFLLAAGLHVPAMAAVEPGISELLPAPEVPAKLMPRAVDMDADGDLDVVFPGCRFGGGDSGAVEDGPMGLWIENLGQWNFAYIDQ